MPCKGKYARWLEKDGLLLLAAWARDGLIDEQIAHNCGISAGTLYDWKNRFPQIAEALKKGKEVVDVQVENALLKRALGYETVEEMTEEGPDGTKIRTTRVPPDVTAQIFWLKNRMPDRWRDKPAPPAPPPDEANTDALSRSLAEMARELTGDDQ